MIKKEKDNTLTIYGRCRKKVYDLSTETESNDLEKTIARHLNRYIPEYKGTDVNIGVSSHEYIRMEFSDRIVWTVTDGEHYINIAYVPKDWNSVDSNIEERIANALRHPEHYLTD